MAKLSRKYNSLIPPGEGNTVPGPSPDSATNLVLADIAIRAVTYLIRGKVEKTLLKSRYSPDAAEKIISNRPPTHILASMVAAKVATRSVPGAAVVGSGIALKTLFDLSQKRRARRRGKKVLDKRIEGDA
ncbi:MAG: hypothetical protein HKO05_00355 [Erythrobacter sp.]|nr:hypothetical protein [Erythrobacter sp.]